MSLADTSILTPPSTKHTATPARSPFAVEASSLVHDLQLAVKKFIDELPTRSQTPAQLSRELGLSPRSGWKIWRFAYETDPLSAVAFLPGDEGFKVFMAAAQSAGASGDAEIEVHTALAKLSELQRLHAGGDRTSFQAMALGMLETGSEEAGTAMRRHAFMGQSAQLGVQAQATYFLMVIEQLPGGDEWRLGGLRSFLGLRRNRQEAQCTIATQGIREPTDESTRPARQRVRQLGKPESFPLVEQFCSRPLPEVVPQERVDGREGFELAPGAVGSTGEVTCCVGSIHIFPRLRDDEAFMAYASNVPVKRAVVDVFVRAQTLRAAPTFEAYNTQAGLAVADHPKFQIPLIVPVQMQGKGLSGMNMAHAPKARQMAKYLFDEMELDPAEFELLRVKINYPPVPAYMGIRVTFTAAGMAGESHEVRAGD